MLKEMVTVTRLFLPGSEMVRELKQKTDWYYDTDITNLDRAVPAPKVRFYSHWWWPWSKSVGGYKNGVISIRRLKWYKMTESQRIGFLAHEYAHHLGFGHGNNYKTQHKCDHSVPYYISENIEKWIS